MVGLVPPPPPMTESDRDINMELGRIGKGLVGEVLGEGVASFWFIDSLPMSTL